VYLLSTEMFFKCKAINTRKPYQWHYFHKYFLNKLWLSLLSPHTELHMIQ